MSRWKEKKMKKKMATEDEIKESKLRIKRQDKNNEKNEKE